MTGFALPSLPASKLKHAPEPTPDASTSEEVTDPRVEDQPPPPPPLHYDPPEWSALCPPESSFSFEILKNGSIVETVKVSKPVMLLGRLPTCDLSQEHASISRHHAVIQSSATQLFLFDLGSAHGTFVNKQRVAARMHVRVREGDLVRFGASSRFFVVVGGPVGEEEVVEEEEVRRQKQRKVAGKVNLEKVEEKEFEVSWGFAEDASEEEGRGVGPGGASGRMEEEDEDALELNGFVADPDAYYYKDSKKALKTWCDSRNVELVYGMEEEGYGITKVFVSTVRLVLEGGVAVTGVGKGARKKEAERQAALETCIKLDRRNILRAAPSASTQGFKRKSAQNEDDDDSFYDRTERTKKPKKADTTNPHTAETYDTLVQKVQDKQAQIDTVNGEIAALETPTATTGASKPEGDDDDGLDQILLGLESSTKEKQKRVLVERRR
ncbi:hypothetical protein HDU98_011814, partial [Podochytrium sp. JEL0797]